jgi:hypothetical protein
MISIQGDGISSWESIYYCLMMLYQRPRFTLVKNVFRIVHSKMCKNTRFGLFTFFGQWKSWHNSIFGHEIDDTARREKRGVIWCKQCSFLVNFRLKYKDINKSNKRQTYTYGIGVLRKKCSPKWTNFTLKPARCRFTSPAKFSNRAVVG